MRSAGSWISCSSTSWRDEFFAGGPAARQPAFRSSKPKSKPKLKPKLKAKPKPKPKQRLPDTLGGGGCGWAGSSASGHVPASAVRFSADPPLLVDANLGWQQLLTLLFFLTLNFALVPRAQETVRSRSKAAGRTVRRMDAPTEPTGTYLRRVLPVALLRLYAREGRRREQRCNPTSHTAHRSWHPCPAPVQS